MKKYLAYPLVVEGKEDASYLSSYIDSEIVVVNGFELSKQTVGCLKNKTIIALLDPDEAGKQIRQKINKELPNVINVEIDINKCIRGKKDGVAECDQEEIIRVLNPHFSNKNPQKSRDLQGKLTKLDLTSKQLREYLSQKYHLGKCNLKKLFIRLETLEISPEELKTSIKEFYGN